MRLPAALLLFALAARTLAAESAPQPVEKAAATAPARAVAGADKIWSAVLVATKPPNPKADPPALGEFVPRLKRIFGYTQYEIIGATTETIDEKAESWLVPSQNFWLQVKARRVAANESRGPYQVKIQLFQDNRPILETEAKISPGSPLFIRGPQHGSGQVIIVLQVQR